MRFNAKDSVVIENICIAGSLFCLVLGGTLYLLDAVVASGWALAMLCVFPAGLLGVVFALHRKLRSDALEQCNRVLCELAETKLTVHTLRRNKALMQSVFNASNNIYYVFDTLFVCQNVITSREDLLEFCHATDPSGQRLEELFSKNFSGRIKGALLDSLERNRQQSIEYSIESNGKERWLEGRALALPQSGCGARLVVWIARDITEEKCNREAVRVLSTRLALSEEQQRRRIAVELHDSLGQILAIVKMRLNLLGRYLKDGDERKLHDAVMEQLGSGIELTRTLVWELSPPTLYALGLVSAVEWLGEKYAKEHDIAFSVEDKMQCCIWGSDFKIMMFRIVRELMANVVKHANATSCVITFTSDSEGVSITVNDNGKGFPEGTVQKGLQKGFGLLTIQESVYHLGGDVQYTSNGVGGNVRIDFPFKQIAPVSEFQTGAATGTYDG